MRISSATCAGTWRARRPNSGRVPRAPVLLLRAPRGLLNQPEPFLSDNSVTKHLPTIPGARHEVVEGTNHYTLVMGVGAAAIADRILEAVRGD